MVVMAVTTTGRGAGWIMDYGFPGFEIHHYGSYGSYGSHGFHGFDICIPYGFGLDLDL